MKKAAVVLSGCGVYDGSEIQEAVSVLLSLEQEGYSYECFAPDKAQHHVLNHATGEEMPEQRNCMVEAARISRGKISSLQDLSTSDYSLLVLVGGFGAAKNLSNWAFEGAGGIIHEGLKENILTALQNSEKQILAICMGPVLVAKALEQSGLQPILSIGNTQESSEYDIAEIQEAMRSLGAVVENSSLAQCTHDKEYGVICAPAYMMEGRLKDIFFNINQAVQWTL